MSSYTNPRVDMYQSLDLIPPGSPKTQLMKLIFRVMDVCPKLKNYKGPLSMNNELGHPEIIDYLRQATDLDTELEKWTYDLAPTWTFSTHPIVKTGRVAWVSRILNLPGAPTMMHRYSSHLAGVNWSLYRVTRLQ